MVTIARRLGVLGLLAGVLALMSSVAVAQDASPAVDMASHPIVGVWKSAPDPGTDVFGADGTLISITADAVIAGVWEPTGPRSAMVTVSFPTPEGQVNLRGDVEVSEDGITYSATYTVEIVGADGTSSGQMGPAEGSGSRVVVEPMGSPIAPLPVGPNPSASPAA